MVKNDAQKTIPFTMSVFSVIMIRDIDHADFI